LVEEEKKHWKHWEDLPEEMDDRLLENMAQFFMKRNLGLVAQMFLDSAEAFTRMFATLGMGLFGPFLEFFGADTYTAFFRKEGNARRLLERVEELEDERLIEKDKDKKG
jgi:hypothetical protein